LRPKPRLFLEPLAAVTNSTPPPAKRPSVRDNPWWIPPFLGSVPELTPAHLRLLQLLAFGLMIENYDLSLINSTLKYILDDLQIATTESGFYLSVIRLGGLLTFLVLPFADRMGRRRVFLGAVLCMSVGTFATAWSQSPIQFVVLQFVTRGAMLTAVATALVIASEEFPAEHRGWAIGMLSGLAGLGYGLGALLFAFVERLPYGWRALYFVGFIPLLLLPSFRRNLSETRRFEDFRANLSSEESERSGLGAWLRPLAKLVRTDRRRTLGLGAAALIHAIGSIAVFQYSAVHAQTVHGWEPWRYSLVIVGGGVIGIGGNIVAGRLGDRLGRRRVGFAFLLPYPLFVALYYLGPSWGLWLAFGCFVFCGAVGEVVQRAFATELFATSHRGSAAGGLILVQTLGWSLGLMLFGALTTLGLPITHVVAGLSLLVSVAGLCFLILPETRQRELEETSR